MVPGTFLAYNISMDKMYIFLIVLGLVSISHFVFIVLKKEWLRRISKCFIIPVLFAVYIAGAENPHFLIIAALILGWIGDVLLINIQKKIFLILGLTSFLLGHICYITAFIKVLGFFGFDGAFGKINLPAIIIFTPPAIVLAMVVFRLIKPTKELYLPVILYMAVLEALTLFGFQVFIFNPGVAGLLLLSGCICFMVSDTILAYYTFRKLKILGAVLIMAYYILAQTEIVMGMLLM